MNPVKDILRRFGVNQTDLARELGVNRATICMWAKRGRIPVREVKKVSDLTGIPCHELCPEYFPTEYFPNQDARQKVLEPKNVI